MSGDEISRFGHTYLPDEQEAALDRAKKLEWLTIGYYVFDTVLLFLVLGNSQAMRTAWVQDLLAFLPPIAFLIAVRVAARRPTEKHPYGFHRSVGIAHLVAAIALFVVGAYLLVSSGMGLVTAEHPTIGGIEVLGHTIWLGWLMIGALLLTAVPPVILGRIKMKLSQTLHDKVLFADAEMNKADWMTTVAAIAGVMGIGFGLWWADSVAAILISFDILRDGIKNLRGAVAGLMDTRAQTYDDSEPDPLTRRLDEHLENLDWVAQARSRVRDEGHVYHVESFTVPVDGRTPSLETIEQTRRGCIEMDWKIKDMVIVLVAELPEELLPGIDGETHCYRGNR